MYVYIHTHTHTHTHTQGDLELLILLPASLKWLDYRHVPTHAVRHRLMALASSSSAMMSTQTFMDLWGSISDASY